MKRIHLRLTWIVLFLISLIFSVYAQFSIQGQIRPRSEFRHGYRSPFDQNTQEAFFISQRSRLTLELGTPAYKMHVAIQDVRVWGEEAQLQDIPSQALHEAWIAIPLSKRLSLRAGRQELVYDDHRLLGNVNWTQQARSHDALVVQYQTSSFRLDMGGAFNNDAEKISRTPYTVVNYRTLGFLWIQWNAHPSLTLSWYSIHETFVDNGRVATNTQNRLTIGPHVIWSPGFLTTSISAFYQTGTTATDLPIRAYFLAWQIRKQWHRFTLFAGMDYISGQKSGVTNQYTAFHTLYATNHKFYGTMDYFLNIPKDTRYGGLVDSYLKFHYSPTDRFRLSLDTHYFRLASNAIFPSYPTNFLPVSLSPNLGIEFDFAVNLKIANGVMVQGGYSQMFGTDSFFTLKGGNKQATQNWAWLMLVVQTQPFEFQ